MRIDKGSNTVICVDLVTVGWQHMLCECRFLYYPVVLGFLNVEFFIVDGVRTASSNSSVVFLSIYFP